MNKQVKERPILFNAEMVRAVLNGRKTVTRRVVKGDIPQTPLATCGKRWGRVDGNHYWCGIKSPYGAPGDKLWVRETWALCGLFKQVSKLSPDWAQHQKDEGIVWYRADGESPPPDNPTVSEKVNGRGRWRPSIHMPRWASRILLEVVSVKVERVQEIDEPGAQAEGVTDVDYTLGKTYVVAFNSLWWDMYPDAEDAANWDNNPWVWVVEFKRVAS